ncbi:Transcriptional repressor scratch 1 [Chamberlinius hualienensis]
MPRCYLFKKVKYPVERDRSPGPKCPYSPSEATVAPSPPPPYHSSTLPIHNGFLHDLPTNNTTTVLHETEVDNFRQTEHDTECAKQLLDLSLSRVERYEVVESGGAMVPSPCGSHVSNNGLENDHNHVNINIDNNSDDDVTMEYNHSSINDNGRRAGNGRSRKKIATTAAKSVKQKVDSGSSASVNDCPHSDDATYVSMPALAMHVLTHNLSHKCDMCGKAFSRPWLLQGHMRSHTGEKPYGCAHCGKSFADRSNLRAHMQTHSTCKNFKCKRCNKSFALKSYLNKHYESACFKDSSSTFSSSSNSSNNPSCTESE